MLRLPFHALITRPPEVFALADADWFIRSHAISVIPSVAALAPLRRGTDKAPDRPRRMLGLGDPRIGSGPPARCGAIRVSALRSSGGTGGNMYAGAYEDGLPLADPVRLSTLSRLPDSACELQSIAGSVGAERATLLLQQDATETRVKDMNRAGGLAAFDILVFATHGLVAGETSAVAPGLVLSPPAQATLLDDGLLTAAEVAALTLDADLVVLSACNTAAGDQANQDGLSGLARAFFHAGARSLMVTHWAVYSDAAVQVSTGVFAALDRDPSLTNAAALRQSVLAILADPTAPPLSRHPAFWAAFAIVGG